MLKIICILLKITGFTLILKGLYDLYQGIRSMRKDNEDNE